VLTHDTTAFVEEIAVPISDRRADRLRRQAASADLEAVHVSVELRLAEQARNRLEERGDLEADSASSHVFGLLRRGSTTERASASRRLVAELREKLTAKRERAAELEREARQYESMRPRNISFRLHSEHHHTTYSENQYARMWESQRTRPVLVTTLGGLSWWWYLNRFWWDDEHLAASEVRALVLERDSGAIQQREATEHARARAVGGLSPAAEHRHEPVRQSVRSAVWTRDGGRCVDCDTNKDLVFDVIVPVSRGGSLNPPNIELRCRSCLSIAGRSWAGADDAADMRSGAGHWRSPAWHSMGPRRRRDRPIS
jgi:5-methylcytosine-specific restriction endonuclease McrA